MATKVYDFRLDDDGDIYINPITMDFEIIESDRQHIKDIMQSVPGYIKEFPLVGWNPYAKLNAKSSKQEVNQSLAIALQGDGYVKGPGGVNVDLLPSGKLDIKTIDVYRP